MPYLHKRKRKLKRKYSEKMSKKAVLKQCSTNESKLLTSSREIEAVAEVPVRKSIVKNVVGWCYYRFISMGTTLLFPWPSRKSNQFEKMAEEINFLKSSIKTLEQKVEELSHNQSKTTPNPQINVLQPPSPPTCSRPTPPPPPPPPPPIIAIQRCSSIPNKPHTTVNRKAEPRPVVTGVSLSAINSIKLKRVSNDDLETLSAIKRNKLASRSNALTVSLKDITSVKLRSRTPLLVKQQNVSTPVIDQKQLHRTLRKTNVVRSPGGTPLVNRDSVESTGTGLTPHMTRALLKKFKSVKSSPIHEDDSKSPLRM